MEVLRSGFRHGVEGEDIRHALRHALLVEEIDDDPIQWPAVIHAMPMRAKYLPPLARRS